MLLHVVHHEAYLKPEKLFQVHSKPRTWRLLLLPGFHAERALSWDASHLATAVAIPALLWRTKCPLQLHPRHGGRGSSRTTLSAPYKSSAPHRNMSNTSLGFVSLVRAVTLTPLKNHCNMFLLCLQSGSQTRCKLRWLKSELVLRTKHPPSTRVPAHPTRNMPKETGQRSFFEITYTSPPASLYNP